MGGTVKIPLLVLALTLLVGTSHAQEAELLPCARWRALVATPEPTTLLGEAQRRQLIDGALGRVERLHVDPGFDGVDLDELRRAYAPRITSARYDHEVIALVQEMLAWVDADLLTREELEDERGLGSFTGVGINVSPLSDGHVLGVNHVFPGSPAEAAGLARGDRIVGVDQRSGCPHPNDIRGPAGTGVTLTVTSPGQPPRRVTITRAAVEPLAPPRAVRLAEPGVGYLWPGNLAAAGQFASVRAALDDIGAFGPTDPLDGLVLDLRGVIGQNEQALNALRSLAGLFADGPLLQLVERSSGAPVVVAAQPERLDDVALVILVDAATTGFHGMFAAALQARQRALVVGEPVHATWRLYRFERLPDGSEVSVPVGEIALVDGTRLRQSGLIPDRVMTVDWRDFAEDDDPYVAEAIRLIRTGGIGID
jgi:carboxyl-terminal processing protease